MAAEIAERPDGITITGINGVNPTADVEYLITGATSLDDAMTLLDPDSGNYAIPLQFDLFGTGNVMLPLASTDPNEIGNGIWEVIARYSYTEAILEAMEFAFETSGGTQHIVHSLGSRGYAPADKTAPSCHGLIGATADGIEGVDVGVPAFQWTEMYAMLASEVTAEFKLTCYNLTNKVNTTTFRGFDAKTVQFLGASGAVRALDSYAYITLRFTAQPRIQNYAFGDAPDQIIVDYKDGWEYITIRAERETDEGVLNQKPKLVYVHTVFDHAEFGDLGFGN